MSKRRTIKDQAVAATTDTEGHRRAVRATEPKDVAGHRARPHATETEDVEGHRARPHATEGKDVEGHSFLIDPHSARQVSRDRSAELERAVRDRARQKEARPNKQHQS